MDKVCITKRDDDKSFMRYENPWNKFDDVMVEIVLAQLPTVDILRCLFVCKRWYSIIHSPTFKITSHQLFNRRPWFLIFKYSKASLVYDMEIFDWRRIQLVHPPPTNYKEEARAPIVASSGLLCFKSGFGSTFTVCNPLTGLARPLPKLCSNDDYITGIAMHASSESNYKVFVAFGNWPHLDIKMFSSDQEKAWMDLPVRELIDGNTLQRMTDIGTSAFIKLRGVTNIGHEGQVLVHFLSESGILLRLDAQKGTIAMCPRLTLPQRPYINLDLVECAGRVFVVVLIQEDDTSKLCVWEFSHEKLEWQKIATMPENISDNFFNAEVHLSCAAYDDYILVCVNVFLANDKYHNDMMMYNIKKNTWVDVPRYFNDKMSSSAAWVCSFKPDIEAKV